MSDVVELIPGPVDLLDPADRLHEANAGKRAWYLGLDGLASGPVARDLIGANTGTLSGGATWGPTTRPGGYGQLNLAGSTTAVVDLPTPAAFNLDRFTVGAWVRPTSTLTGGVFYAIYRGGGSSGDGVGALYLVGNKLTWYGTAAGNPSGSGVIATGATSLAVGTWYRAIATCDGTTTTLYLNGTPDASATFSSTLTTVGTRKLGNDNFSQNFPGAIDDFLVADRAWSAAEARADFDLSGRGYPAGLNRIDPGVAALGASGGGTTTILVGSGGSFALTGGSAIFLESRKLVGTAGSFSLAGGSATFLESRRLVGSGGSYALSGGSAAFLESHKLVGSAGSYSLTGGPASFVPVSPGTLVGSAGAFALSGGSAAFLRARKLVASGGAYALAGGPAQFSKARILAAAGGTFTLTPGLASLLHARLLAGSAGTFALAGGPARFVTPGGVALDTSRHPDPSRSSGTRRGPDPSRSVARRGQD